jgi:hypothetical protein
MEMLGGDSAVDVDPRSRHTNHEHPDSGPDGQEDCEGKEFLFPEGDPEDAEAEGCA